MAKFLTLLVLAVANAGAQAPAPPSTAAADSASRAVFRRAQRLVNDGQGTEGRALVDSMLNAAAPLSPAEAEALYWRAMLAESWDAAQRDYLRLMLEHERSPRAAEAMLRLAQGEATRGDRDAAITYLERLVREAPESPVRAEAGLWHGRILLEQGAVTRGCPILRENRSRVSAGAIELENQFDYLLRACPEAAVQQPTQLPTQPAAQPPAPQPTPQPATVTPPAAPAPSSAAPAANAPSGNWSIQVAALTTLAEANALVARLRAKGHDARVDGRAAPFRVRIGRYPTKEAAASAAADYKTRERADAFVVEVPRG